MTDETIANNKTAGTVAVTASIAAVACGICCVLPFALPAAVLGSVGGTLAVFANAYSWLTPIAVLAVVAGWLWVIYQSLSTGRRPARSTMVTMAFATVAMVLALLWPTFEGPLIALLR